MYCRKCGAHINEKAQFCEKCGTKVVIMQQEKPLEKKVKPKIKLKNPYLIPGVVIAIIAFGLGIFPWPREWQIGTSLWMRILILALALVADYCCTKAKQLNRLYHIQYKQEVKPKLLNGAYILSGITTVVALFALFMM